MSGLALEVTGVHKAYRKTRALNGLSLRVPRGSIYGFLGRNGAGKTTTIKIVLGLVRADSGSARVLGLDSRADLTSILERTAVVHESKILYDTWTPRQLARFCRGFYRHWSDEAVARYAQMLEVPMDRPFGKLSKGNRTKVCLLLALAQNAELMILDEPTSGLDPVATDALLGILVEDHAAAGRTVLFSTHQLAEVEQIADWVGIIHEGRMLLEAPLDDVRNDFRLVISAGGALPLAENVVSICEDGGMQRYVVAREAERFVAGLKQSGAVIASVAPMNLREVFLEIIRKEEQPCTSGNAGATRASLSSVI